MRPISSRPVWAVLVILATLAALAAPVQASAQAGGVEVCDVPPRYGVEATAAAIVRTACQEHRLWLRSFIEADGRLAALGVTEAERVELFDEVTPAWQRVARYWRESGTLSAMIGGGTPGASSCLYPGGVRETDNDCRAFLVDNPWSAAFISWVMARAPLPGFTGSPRHLDYIARAWRQPDASPYLYADPFTSKAAPGDMLCFLRAGDHGLGPQGLREALAGNGRMPSRSHCDIVVGGAPRGAAPPPGGAHHTLYLIGGNVLNAVVMRKLPLDRSGRLLPEALGTAGIGIGTAAAPATPGPAVPAGAAAAGMSAGEAPSAEDSATPIVAAACRPGHAAACSFNRRDWAVLLKLKPQAQLRGAPAAWIAPPAPMNNTPAQPAR